MKRGSNGWRPMAPVLTITKGEFSFLIALGKQLERALELELDGSAPDFVSDALGVLANGLDGLTGEGVGAEDQDGEHDDVSEADDDEASGMEAEVASDGAGARPRTRAVGGTLPGTRALNRVGVIEYRRVAPFREPRPKAATADVPRGTRKKGGKRRGKKQTKR